MITNNSNYKMKLLIRIKKLFKKKKKNKMIQKIPLITLRAMNQNYKKRKRKKKMILDLEKGKKLI